MARNPGAQDPGAQGSGAQGSGARNPGAQHHPASQNTASQNTASQNTAARNTAAGQDEPALITDAERSFDEEQRARKKVYAILMVIHLAGFALAGVLAHIWWLALGLVALTGPLPWVAVVLANDRRTTKQRRIPRAQRRQLEQ